MAKSRNLGLQFVAQSPGCDERSCKTEYTDEKTRQSIQSKISRRLGVSNHHSVSRSDKEAVGRFVIAASFACSVRTWPRGTNILFACAMCASVRELHRLLWRCGRMARYRGAPLPVLIGLSAPLALKPPVAAIEWGIACDKTGLCAGAGGIQGPTRMARSSSRKTPSAIPSHDRPPAAGQKPG